MRTTLCVCGLSLLSLCAWTGASEADVIVRGPFGRTVVAVTPNDPTVVVQAPGVIVQQPTAPLPPPKVLIQPPPPGPIVVAPPYPPPPPPPSAVVPTRPLTHKEFAKIFQPLPGTYNVLLIHPGNGSPVNVTFTLPAGCPKVRVYHREVVFDYGRNEVAIHFAIHGKVRVTSR